MSKISLSFSLDVEDDWPPVSVECLPFEFENGLYTALVAPLFVKDLSVGDRISAELDANCSILSWHHVHRSDHTTVWLLRTADGGHIEAALAQLRALGCNTVSAAKMGCYSVDVPRSVSLADVDDALSMLDESAVAVAFPSLRHEEARQWPTQATPI